MSLPTLISPSILAADFANLGRDIHMLNQSEADYLHIDIMDGIFVPNISFGFSVTEAVNRHATKPLDFHLMIAHADPYLEKCVQSGARIISVHFEACQNLHRTILRIKELGAKAGVAINPHTPANALDAILPELDLVLVMSVNPGYGGQKFIEGTYDKVRKLRAMAERQNPGLWIEIDGGVGEQNAKKLLEAGANMLVAGSSVFQSHDPLSAISKLKHA